MSRFQHGSGAVLRWVLWTPRRAATVATSVVVAMVVAVVLSVTVSLGTNLNPAPSVEAGGEGAACTDGVQQWVDVLTNQSIQPGVAWSEEVRDRTTPDAGRWITATARDLVPPGPATVAVSPAERGVCAALVTFADGSQWKASAVPSADGPWLVNSWDDQT